MERERENESEGDGENVRKMQFLLTEVMNNCSIKEVKKYLVILGTRNLLAVSLIIF